MTVHVLADLVTVMVDFQPGGRKVSSDQLVGD